MISPRRALLVSVLCALALTGQMLRLGFVLDDLKLVAHADGTLPQARPLDYFSFARDWEELRPLVEHGPFPWWTLPGIKLAFFRPLSCATLWLDLQLFGMNAWAHHVHSILWFLALIGAVFLFYRRALGPAVMGVALIAYAIDNVHWIPAGWLANRNALIAAVPAVLGLTAHLRWREAGWAPGRVLAPLAIAVGLTGGESALAYVAYFGAYELVSARPWRDRVLGLAPVLGVVVAWAALYRALGYGASGSDTYLDPGAEPMAFLTVAPLRLLVLLNALTLKASSDWWIILPPLRPAMYVGGALGVAFVAWLARRSWPALTPAERTAVKWLTLGAVLALVPVLATFPADRLLGPASLGAIGVLAVLFRVAWEARKRAVVGFLLLTQGAVPIPSWFIGPAVLKHVSSGGERVVLEAPPAMVEKRVVLLNTGEIGAALYGPMYLHRAGRPKPQRWWVLTLDPHPHRLTRVAERSIELEVLGGRMLDAWYERLVRAEKRGFREGEQVRLAGAVITVVKADGGKPVKLRVDFERPMEEHALVQWKDGKLVEVPAPEVGASVDVEGVPSPLELQL